MPVLWLLGLVFLFYQGLSYVILTIVAENYT